MRRSSSIRLKLNGREPSIRRLWKTEMFLQSQSGGIRKSLPLKSYCLRRQPNHWEVLFQEQAKPPLMNSCIYMNVSVPACEASRWKPGAHTAAWAASCTGQEGECVEEGGKVTRVRPGAVAGVHMVHGHLCEALSLAQVCEDKCASLCLRVTLEKRAVQTSVFVKLVLCVLDAYAWDVRKYGYFSVIEQSIWKPVSSRKILLSEHLYRGNTWQNVWKLQKTVR